MAPSPDQPLAPTPFVSIVVPVRNEVRNIEIVLQQCRAQTWPADRMEVLVVAAHSTDGTTELILAEVARDPRIRLLKDEGKQRSSGLNTAIREARGEVVVRLDARSRIEPDYVERCLALLQRVDAENVGGRMQAIGDSPTQKAIAIAMGHPFGVGDATFRIGQHAREVDTIYPGVFKREVFDRIGYFDDFSPVISEDSDLNYRLRRAGGRIYFDPSIVVRYVARETLGGLGRLYYRYGGAKAGFGRKHRVLTSWRQLVAPALVLMLIVSGIALPFSVIAMWLLLSTLLAWLLAASVASVHAASRAGDTVLAPRVMVAFAVMHFPWGLGFLRRMLQLRSGGFYWK
jgi:glycosyltransferase involved in cell wall biosynthesis